MWIKALGKLALHVFVFSNSYQYICTILCWIRFAAVNFHSSRCFKGKYPPTLRHFPNDIEITFSRRHHPQVSFEQILDPEKLVEGSPNVILNSVVMDKDNRTVYVTVSSTKFPLRNALFELISDPTGRVLQIDLETRQVNVLKEGLNFANGIEIDSKGEYLLVTETGRAAIHKIFLKGPKKYECEKLKLKLPGLPDNIRLNERGNFYVGIISPRLPNTVHIQEIAATHNLVRKFISR